MFEKGNKAAKKAITKESYIMIRVTQEFKAKVVKASGKRKLSQYVSNLIENDENFKRL